MPYLRSAFSRILEPVDRRMLRQVVDRHGGNRGVGAGDRAWTCQRHLKALIFAQLTGAKSLRDIEAGLKSHPGALYHLGLRPVGKSTLADASSARPNEVFRDVAETLVAGLQRRRRQEATEFIRLIDGSPISIRDRRFTWAEADSRCRGLKLHLVYDPRGGAPVQFDITSPKVAELKVARTFDIVPGTTYVFDKGYTDFNWWQDIVEAKAFFVTRLKSNAKRRNIEERRTTGDGIIADRTLQIGHRKPRGGATNRLYDTELREVVVARETDDPLHLVTNDHKRSAREIADLYKERWEIELFFKWMKQNLKITAFFGRSENAVRTQIYAAIITFCLLHLFRKALPQAGGRMRTLLAQIKVSIFGPFDLSSRSPPMPRPPSARPSHPQLALPLGART